jgi:hypothetical protein
MDFVEWGSHQICTFILSGNPFSGFSHQGSLIDTEMRRYFTTANIKETLHHAEKLNINTIVARADQHTLRTLFEYYEEGGTIQLLAQTCLEYASPEHRIIRAANYGATDCHIHGGVMDHLLAHNRLTEVIPLLTTHTSNTSKKIDAS